MAIGSGHFLNPLDFILLASLSLTPYNPPLFQVPGLDPTTQLKQEVGAALYH